MRQNAEVFGKELNTLEREPRLSGFYTPNPKQQDYETAFVIGCMASLGLLVYKGLE